MNIPRNINSIPARNVNKHFPGIVLRIHRNNRFNVTSYIDFIFDDITFCN